jgi:DNA-binding NarL/FixJ family response regulator
MSPKILIVDDHDVVRHGLRSFLAVRPDWVICGEASSGEEAIQAAAALNPDLVILDVTMPGMSGFETASRIRALNTGIRVLIFTMHESPRIAEDVREAGAQGFVQKSQAARDLIIAVDEEATPPDHKSRNPSRAAKVAPKSSASFCYALSPA